MEEVIEYCCPQCLQHSSLTLALVEGRHHFVEDCQNCCAPVEFRVEVRDGEVAHMEYDHAG